MSTQSVVEYNKRPIARERKRSYSRRQRGIVCQFQRPRKYKFGFMYKISDLKMKSLVAELTKIAEEKDVEFELDLTKDLYLMPLASAHRLSSGPCCIVSLEDGELDIEAGTVETGADGISGASQTSVSIRFAIDNLADTLEDASDHEVDLFLHEFEGILEIVEEQERTGVKPVRRRRIS